MINLRGKLVLAVSILLLLARSTPAQEVGTPAETPSQSDAADSQSPPAPVKSESGTKRFLKDIWTDQKAIWSSPFRMNRRQLFTIALPLSAATAGLIATDEEAARLLPNTPDQIRWSNRVSRIGATYTLGGIVGGTLVVGKVKDKPDVFRMGRLSAEALVDTVIVNHVLKVAAARERPDQNDGQGRFWKGGDSFPSGHSMDSWAVAIALARTKGCPKWLAITSYSVATLVSLSRFSAHRHFPSDILVGSVFGGLIGNYVATRPRN